MDYKGKPNTREICAMGFDGHSMSVIVSNNDLCTLSIDGHRKIRMERLQAAVLGKVLIDWAEGK